MKRLPAFITVDALIIIAAVAVMLAAMASAADIIAGMLDRAYIFLAIGLPDFDYSISGGAERGNETFAVYGQMRLLGAAFAASAAALTLPAAVKSGMHSGRIVLGRYFLLLVLFAAFPPFWDAASSLSENAALWMLNPAYSFDSGSPCPASWDKDRIAAEYGESPYRLADSDDESVCRPDLRSKYVIWNVAGGIDAKSGSLEDLGTVLAEFALPEAANAVLGIMQAAVAISVLFMTAIIGTAVDIILAVAISAMPLFAALSMIPQFRAASSKFLDTIPALLLLPVISSVVLLVGSSFVAAVPAHDAEGALYAWLASVAVLLLTVLLPVLMVPLAGPLAAAMTSAVSFSVSTAAAAAAAGSSLRLRTARNESAPRM